MRCRVRGINSGAHFSSVGLVRISSFPKDILLDPSVFVVVCGCVARCQRLFSSAFCRGLREMSCPKRDRDWRWQWHTGTNRNLNLNLTLHLNQNPDLILTLHINLNLMLKLTLNLTTNSILDLDVKLNLTYGASSPPLLVQSGQSCGFIRCGL